MSLINDLKKIGLNEKEAKVYLALLVLGRGAVQEIALKADIKRSTAYVILEDLIKMGLCGTLNEKSKTVYSASNPEAIKSMIELQKKELDERLDYFDKVRESLNLLNNKNKDNRPVVSFYEGQDGLLNSAAELNFESVEAADNIRSIYPLDRLNAMLDDPKIVERRKKNRARRKKMGLGAKVICNSSKLKEFCDDLDEYIVLDANKYPIEADINIVGDIVRATTWDGQNSAIIIRKKQVAQTLKTIFDLAWLGAQTLKKK